MRLWRRRQPAVAASLPSIRLERAVVAMAAHAAQLADRLDRLERRVEDAEDTAYAALAPGAVEDLIERLEAVAAGAGHADDLLELRLEHVRLAAELRSELVRVAALAAEQGERSRRLEALASVVADLTDGDDWAASA